jgi:ribonuclease J
MSDFILKVQPVGGVGQIGSNMTLLKYKNHKILIDAGILFPSEDFFDLDFLIPDLTKMEKPDTLIITHGHEDHIGAIYNVITQFPEIKVYAPRFAAALIRKKLEYNKHPYPITIFNYNDTLTFDELVIDPIHVNHSIPDTYGLLARLPILNLGILFISDFKIDFKTKYEAPFDFEKLKKLSSSLTKKILLADSTNIASSTLETPSEFDLIPSFEEIFSKAESRIFVTLFSSNIHRIKTIIDMAEKYQFKVVPYGRSMISYINSAIEEGIYTDVEKVLKSSDSVKRDQENLVVLLSGCQGDFLGTFRRVSTGEDSLFKPRSTDTFVISSKAIPGNEKKISQLLNKISEIGAKIYSPSDLPIHVSGHPGKNDLAYLYDQFKPTDIIPIHGETYFIREHIEHIKKVAPYATSHFVLNHDELLIDSNLRLSVIQGEKQEPVIYHGKNIIIERERISERRKMACNGTVFVSLKLDKGKVSSYDFNFLGLPNFIHSNLDAWKVFIDNEIERANPKDPDHFKEELRISIRRYFDNKVGYKPTTVVHIL